MIPTEREILAGATFLSQRYGVETPSLAIVVVARNEAVALAEDAADEPAALFFAFSRRARALRSAWAVLPDLLALNQAVALGLDVRAQRGELRALRVSVATGAATFDEVRQRFRAWTA